MHSLLNFCVMVFLTAGFAVSAFAQAEAKKREPDRSIVYKRVDDVELRIHLFEPKRTAAAKKAPAVVFFFGGGWVSGSPGQFHPQCAYLASRGMVAMSAEYRVASRNGTSPFECVRDGKSAVRWVRAHADELGIDPDKIVAGGGSAGGHVAACTGVLDGYDAEGEDLTVSSKPVAMVLFNPVIDTTALGYGSEKLPGLQEKLSPTHHVRPGVAPTIVFHGTADPTVPFENVERFRDLMLEAGNRCELVPFEGKKHGFFNLSRDEDSFDKTMVAADAFLVSQGLLEERGK